MPLIEGLDLKPGLYHYAPKEHGLELRAEFPAEHIARLLAPFPSGAFLFGLTSVHWREAWKYGERAFRYCNHDVGHAIGSARIAAATLGWKMALLDGTLQETVALLLGTNRVEDFAEVEPEHPDCLAVMWPLEKVKRETLDVKRATEPVIPLFLDAEIVQTLAAATWHGKANRLSGEHGVEWEIIDEAAAASWKASCERQFCRCSHFCYISCFTVHISRCPIRRPDHSSTAKCRVVRWKNINFGGDILSHDGAGDALCGSAAIGSTDAVGCLALRACDSSFNIRASCGWIDARAVFSRPRSEEAVRPFSNP